MPNDQNDRLKPPSKPTSYEVGYGKPPKASRFAPGQAGMRENRLHPAQSGPLTIRGDWVLTRTNGTCARRLDAQFLPASGFGEGKTRLGFRTFQLQGELTDHAA
jgi:hypothetical protein